MSDQLTRLFAALADPTRRDLVTRLAVGDATVGDLAAPYEMSKQAISKHVKVLTDAGLVVRDLEARRQPVRLDPEVLGLLTSWITRHQQAAEQRYQRLDSVLAESDDDPVSTTDRARRRVQRGTPS